MAFYNKKDIYFYLLLFITLGAIFFTHPFLRFPYDMWDHLFAIDDFNISQVPGARDIWHAFWRHFFALLSIEQEQILLRARIIHTIQTLLSFFAVYLFSKVLIRHIFTHIDHLTLRYMAYWSTLIWFTIFATFSVFYHHIWILWYSVNYQITLPLFWYILALTIIILFEPISWKIKLFYGLQIILISRFILQAHSMEYLYYLMYLAVLLLLYSRELFPLFKKYYYLVIPLALLPIFFSQYYQAEKSQLFTYLHRDRFSDLYSAIIEQGNLLLAGANRADAAVNELMKVALFSGTVMLIVFLLRKIRGKDQNINQKMLLFLFITSLFFLIPLYTFSGGFAAIVTKMGAVNRFYYSASLFVLLPVSLYYFISLIAKKNRILYLNLAVPTIVLLTFFYSKYISPSHNYANNIHSFLQSFNEREVGFNLSGDQIKTIGIVLERYKSQAQDGKEILYYARPDIATVLKFIYRENVYWRGRRNNPSLEKFQKYMLTLDPEQTQGIVFETPEGFPDYTPYH